MVKLPTFQAAVMAHIFEKAPVAQTADTLDFRFHGEFTETFYAAYVALNEASGYLNSSLVLTLATHSDVVFMGVTEARQVDVARALGSLEDYDRESHAISTGDVVRIPDPHFAALGLYAVVLLRPAVLSGFEVFDDCWTIKSRHLRFVLALFLTEEEYLFWKSQGHDALMDRFTEENRSVVIFPRTP